MKIASIYLKSFLGVQLVHVETPQPVQLFVGGNGAGKSSIRDACALAIAGQLPRVSLKKEAAALVREGADGADCEIHVKGPDAELYAFGITAGGKLSQLKNLKPEVAFVVDAQRFAQLPEAERRTFLFELMRVKTAPADIVEELVKGGHDKMHVAAVQPLLRAGFEPACKDAKERATACKGAWRQVTGEVWGSEKAKGWKAMIPALDPAKMKQLQTELEHCDVALASWNEQKGRLRADLEHRQRRQAELAPLREKIALEQRHRDKLAVDQAELDRLKPLLERALAEAGAGPRVGIMHDLAAALQPLIKVVELFDLEPAEKPVLQHAQLTLANYEALHGRVGGGVDPVEATARAQRLKAASATCQSAIDNCQRHLNAALEAKAQIIHIEAELAQPIDTDALAEADKQITELTEKRRQLQAELETQKSLKTAADQAETKTKMAAEQHRYITAWDALGDALAPGGLPAQLLDRALGPLNERLKLSAGETDWPLVTIDGGMHVTADGRDYRLLSVSERWRVDAMIAEAISYLSGMRLLVLDGFDVLEPARRGALIGWLDLLASEGEIDTALVFGTLKEAPKGMPETVGVHWLMNGTVAEPLKAAA